MALGAILSFAVGDRTDAIDLPVVGYILMVAGAVGVVLSLVLNKQATDTTHHEIIETHKDQAPLV